MLPTQLSSTDQAEIVAYLGRLVRTGTRPSLLYRCVRHDYPMLKAWKFGELLAAAFPPHGQNFPQLTLSWQDRDPCPAWDHHYDLQLIAILLHAGEALAWDPEFCCTEWSRLQPLLADAAATQHARDLASLHEDRLLERIGNLPGRPVCVQVLWEGDANSWRLRLSVYMLLDETPVEIPLASIATGEYLRFDTDPAEQTHHCKESTVMLQVARHLSQSLGIPYHYPSPDRPDDTALSWLESLHDSRSNASRPS
ncbi:hypothetical protein [Chitinimonas naiadis]